MHRLKRFLMSTLLLGAATECVAAAAVETRSTPAPSTSAPPLSIARRVLAVGDSLTAGYNVARVDSYPSVLAQRMGIHVRNAGISGEMSDGLLRRLPGLLRSADYDTVLLCTGGNDILRGRPAQQLKRNLERSIDLIRAAGATPVLIAVPMLPFALVDHPIYAEVAAAKSVPMIGGFGLALGREHFQADGLHPNAAGYRQIVEQLLRAADPGA